MYLSSNFRDRVPYSVFNCFRQNRPKLKMYLKSNLLAASGDSASYSPHPRNWKKS